MTELADEPTTLMFHAEMIPPITDSVGDDVQISHPPLVPKGPLNSYWTFLDSRPPSFETYAIEEIISLAHIAPKLPLHIVHLSAVEAIPILRAARESGIKITAETCFHYLSLAAENIADGDTRHKCCPPIRKQANQETLWSELLCRDDSVIQTIVSDHSPCTPDLKLLPPALSPASAPPSKAETAVSGDFFAAWGGVSSVGLGLPLLWTAATSSASARPITIEDIVRLCCRNTAKQVGLSHIKGDLKVGMDGDIAVFDDEAEWIVNGDRVLWRNRISPYFGKKVRGLVKETWIRGQKVFCSEGVDADNEVVVGRGFDVKSGPVGRLLLEPRTS